MSVWVVVGGQYGSEGKGKVAAYITLREEIDICVRCGGPNSGHCFVDEHGELRALRQIPTGYVRRQTRLLIPSGGIVDLGVLRKELDTLRLGPDRVGIDSRAMVIEQADRDMEERLDLRNRLSSTLCGVGSAVARKIMRGEDVKLARDAATQQEWLRPYLTDTAIEINEGIDKGRRVLVEGTQGFGLSLYHSTAYPKTTSRDTSAAGCISECGISPRLVTNIVMVLRTFPIRVAGEQAGPMFHEVDWETIRHESGSPKPIAEYTTVTGKLRRVGRFDFKLAKRAALVNRPTEIALNFLDYVLFTNGRATSWSEISENAMAMIAQIESVAGAAVRFVGTGPRISDIIPADGSHGYPQTPRVGSVAVVA